MRSLEETNAINRVLKAWKIGSLEEPGSIQALSRMVQDHDHLTELLKACDPELRREMYDAMSPNLNFPAKPLDFYIAKAKEHASSMEYPTIDDQGNLKPYMTPAVGVQPAVEIPKVELFAQCSRCDRKGFFFGERLADAISEMRHAGWSYDEMGNGVDNLCPQCLEEYDDALDPQAGQAPPE